MRYYSIIISGAPSAFPAVPGASKSGAQWDSWINGVNDPGTQQVEFSIEEIQYAQPGANCVLTIHGVSFEQIRQSANLIRKPIQVWGGMKPGLPLASSQASQSGMLVNGVISACWANWVGTDMSLGMTIGQASAESSGQPSNGSGDNFTGIGGSSTGSTGQPTPSTTASAPAQVPDQQLSLPNTGFRSIDQRAAVTPTPVGLGDIVATIGGAVSTFIGGGGSVGHPANLVHNMQPNQLLSDAIRQTLSTAFPGVKTNIAISPALKLAYQDAGLYLSLEQIAGYWKQLSHSILGNKNYLGVNVTSNGNSINVWDGTNGGIPKESSDGKINFSDLIGQPTWVSNMNIHFKTVLRADIHQGMKVTLPSTLTTTSADSIVPYRSSDQRNVLSFHGDFYINAVTHIGDFRNPDGNGWCTNFEAVPVDQTQGQTQAAQDVANSNVIQSADPNAALQHSGFEDTPFNPSGPPPTGNAPSAPPQPPAWPPPFNVGPQSNLIFNRSVRTFG